MAQNEIQKYTSDQDLYNNVRNVLETWYNNYQKLEKNGLSNCASGDIDRSKRIENKYKYLFVFDGCYCSIR